MVFVILGLIGLVAVGIIWIYNRLVQLRMLTENAWADISVQLKRRHDLIPNLVNTVKGYASHEKEVLEHVTEARARAMGAQQPGEATRFEGDLTRALKSLFAIAEAYPQLRASENFAELQTSLNQIEEAIQSSRRYYNAVVRDYNTKLEQFPTNIVGQLFSFQKRDFFEIEPTEAEVPTVDFSGS